MLICFLLTICFPLCCVIPLQGVLILLSPFVISLSQLSRPMLSRHFIYMASSHLRYIQSCLFSFGISVYQYILYIPRTQQLLVSDLKLTELLVISFIPLRDKCFRKEGIKTIAFPFLQTKLETNAKIIYTAQLRCVFRHRACVEN